MKKILMLMLTLILTLCAGAAMADAIPAEIEKLFDVPAWEAYHIPFTTSDPDRYACFLADERMMTEGRAPIGLVVMKKGDNNVLCLLQKRNGQWRITGRNHNALPDGDEIPYLYFDFYNDIQLWYGDGPNGETGMISLKYDGRTVRFNGLYEPDKSVDATISDRGITYHLYDVYGDYVGQRTVYGVYDASFEAFNFDYFPRTIEEADAILTNPPAIPGNFISPVELDLRTGEKYDVFSAPGRSSYRPANGKAVMSTNDWVQIFGEEDGWVLVQYDISSGQMRFGYVDASVLPRNASVRALSWANTPYTIVARTTYLTDDPLNSCKILLTLGEDVEVTCLAAMGEWLYVETEATGMTIRGFIPAEDATPAEPIGGWDTLIPNG